MNSKKTYLRAILALLNAFFLFCAVLFWVAYGLCLKKTVIFVAQKSGYAEKSIVQAEEQMNGIALAGGFESGFFNGILAESDVKNNAENLINSAFENKVLVEENHTLKEKISNKIFDFAEKKLHGFSLETREVLEQTAALCVAEISDAFYPDIMWHFCTFSARFKNFFLVAATVFTALFSTTVFLLFKYNKSFLKTSLFSAFISCAIGPILLLLFLRGKTVGVSHLWLKDFFTFYAFLGIFALIAASLVILFFAFSIKKNPVSK